MARTRERRALVALVLLLVVVVLALLVTQVLSGAPRSGAWLSEADAAVEAGELGGAGHDTALTVDGEILAPLSPGRREAVDVTVANAHDEDLRLTRVVLDVSDVDAPGATASRPCGVDDFDVVQGSLGGLVVEGGRSTRLSETDVHVARWPQVRMRDTARNQDGCKRAVLVLTLSAQAVAR